MNDKEIAERVMQIIARLQADKSIAGQIVTPDASLKDCLGMDSLRFLDLTVALEDALGIETFPMQAWVDAQAEIAGPRFRVGDLIAECARVVASVHARRPETS